MTPFFRLTLSSVVMVSLLALLIPTASAAEQSKIKVFLLAGQSNMEGRGDGRKLTPDDIERLEKVKSRISFAYNHKDMAPLGLTTPIPRTAKKYGLDLTFGPELFFGLEMAEAFPDSRFLFIKRSKGGVSLYGCWNPNWSLEKATLMNEEKKPKLYGDFRDYIKEVLSEYDGEEYELSGMLWVQGESDSGKKKHQLIAAKAYRANLHNLIDTVRKDVGVKDFPFMILQVGSGKVVKAMKETARAMENVSFIPQSKDPNSPAHLPKYGPPHGHYNYEGMKRIGQQFAKTYLRDYAHQPIEE